MNSETNSDTCDWKYEYHELRRYADKVGTQIESLKLNEKNLTAKLKEWKEYKECIQSELRSLQGKVEEKDGEVKKLTADLAAKEKELSDMRRELKYACDQLRTEFERQKTALSNAHSRDERVEKKVVFEQSTAQQMLPSKFKTVCEKLRETTKAFDEAKKIMQKDIFSVVNSVAAISKLTGGEENDRYRDLALEFAKLREKNEAKDAQLHRVNKKIKELQRQNERNRSKIDEQRKQLLQETKNRVPEKNGEPTDKECKYSDVLLMSEDVFQSIPTKNSCNI